MQPMGADTDIGVSIPSSQKYRVADLYSRVEDHKKVLKKKWFWELNACEHQTKILLKTTLQTLFDIALSQREISPKFYVPYVEGMISLKMIFEEKEARSGGWLNKPMSYIFGNPYVSKVAYVAGAAGLACSGLAFGLAVYFDHFDNSTALIAAIAIGFFTGVGGCSCALCSEALKRYYDAIKVTPQSISVQNAFIEFSSCFMRRDYDGCDNVLDKLTDEERALIPNYVQLQYLNEHQRNASNTPKKKQRERILAVFIDLINCFENKDYDGCADVLQKLDPEDRFLIDHQIALRNFSMHQKQPSSDELPSTELAAKKVSHISSANLKKAKSSSKDNLADDLAVKEQQPFEIKILPQASLGAHDALANEESEQKNNVHQAQALDDDDLEDQYKKEQPEISDVDQLNNPRLIEGEGLSFLDLSELLNPYRANFNVEDKHKATANK